MKIILRGNSEIDKNSLNSIKAVISRFTWSVFCVHSNGTELVNYFDITVQRQFGNFK